MARAKRLVIALAVVAAQLLAPRAAAQGRRSEKGVAAQTVGNTTLTVEYYRPVARGRTALFGGVVKWGEHWTPGANWAATIDVDQDVRVEGKLLPKGKYSIWTIVRPDTWSVNFHRSARRFHLSRPDSSDRQLSVTVRADSGAHTEVLTYDFPEIATGATTLRLRWGTMVVPLRFTMFAPRLAPVASTARAPYLGRYALEIVSLEAGQPRRNIVVEFTDEADGLHWRDVENPGQPRRDFILSPAGPDHEFSRAQRSADGQWWTQSGLTVVFTVADGKATGFEVRIDDGTTASRGKRIR